MRYGPLLALDNVSFQVNTGEIVALLGPNGAGKSTTMKILTTYLHPTSGRAQVNEFDVLEQPLQARAQIGYLPETLLLYMDMEVRGYLKFVGKARACPARSWTIARSSLSRNAGLSRCTGKSSANFLRDTGSVPRSHRP